jgi:holo-[acyl-carrier protein] synthase
MMSMVRGIGVDIIEIGRIQKSIDSFGDGFLARIFTAGEIQYCSSKNNAAQHFAARFAAKEAVSKALSTGWSGDFAWQDVEIMNDTLGQPRVTLYGKLKETLTDSTILVSLSHSDSHVVAMALIEGDS